MLDAEARGIEMDFCTGESRDLDVTDLGVARVRPVDPFFLDELGFEAEVGGDARDLAGVVALVAADAD